VNATAQAETALETAHRGAHEYDTDDKYGDRLLAYAQVRTLAAVAAAIDRLAEAVENLR